jgi:lipoate-protein ligase A
MSHCANPSTVLLNALLCLEDGRHPGEENMRRDAALLGSATGLLARPQLRFYGWTEETVSYGCFQAREDAERAFPGLPTVVRPTGGGVLRHGFGRDLTYCLVVPYPAGYPKSGPLPATHLLRLGVGESYCAIHRALRAALEAATSLETRLAERKESSEPGQKPGACFSPNGPALPTAGDLLDLETGAKVAGAAQKRTRHGLLQQGSIVLPEGYSAAEHEPAVRRAFAHALAKDVAFSSF